MSRFRDLSWDDLNDAHYDWPAVADLCDRITVLQRGEILAEGPYAEVSGDPRVREAYMGTGHG